MQIKGKKVNFLGDSITEGVGASAPEFMYVNVFERKFEPAIVRNYGIGGTRIARQQNPTVAAPIYDLDFCKRALDMDPDADVVVVFGGTNDFGHGDAPFGSFEDRTSDTFYGACHTLIQELIEKYPTSTIVFMTPLHREYETREGRPPLSAFVSAICEVCEFYSVPVLDLYKTAGICPSVEINKTTYTKDGLHPNDFGMERVADRLGAFLLSL
jgi:lysophospholipase L1-like esterase